MSEASERLPRGERHPAKEWPNTWLWADRSAQPIEIQIIDLLHDIRLLLFAVCIVLMTWG